MQTGFFLLRNGLWGLWLSLTLFWGWEGSSACAHAHYKSWYPTKSTTKKNRPILCLTTSHRLGVNKQWKHSRKRVIRPSWIQLITKAGKVKKEGTKTQKATLFVNIQKKKGGKLIDWPRIKSHKKIEKNQKLIILEMKKGIPLLYSQWELTEIIYIWLS